MFPFEQWAEQRRTGIPELKEFTIEEQIFERPVRFLYPASEQTHNEVNYKTRQAQDTYDTKVWWDVN